MARRNQSVLLELFLDHGQRSLLIYPLSLLNFFCNQIFAIKKATSDQGIYNCIIYKVAFPHTKIPLIPHQTAFLRAVGLPIRLESMTVSFRMWDITWWCFKFKKNVKNPLNILLHHSEKYFLYSISLSDYLYHWSIFPFEGDEDVIISIEETLRRDFSNEPLENVKLSILTVKWVQMWSEWRENFLFENNWEKLRDWFWKILSIPLPLSSPLWKDEISSNDRSFSLIALMISLFLISIFEMIFVLISEIIKNISKEYFHIQSLIETIL